MMSFILVEDFVQTKQTSGLSSVKNIRVIRVICVQKKKPLRKYCPVAVYRKCLSSSQLICFLFFQPGIFLPCFLQLLAEGVVAGKGTHDGGCKDG